MSTRPLVFMNSGAVKVFAGTAAVLASLVLLPRFLLCTLQADNANAERATLAGVVFNDKNKNGIRDADEEGVAGQSVFLDANNNGSFDFNEKFVNTDAQGAYRFNNVDPGTHTLRLKDRPGWILTTPVTGSYTVSITKGMVQSRLDFGSFQKTTDNG